MTHLPHILDTLENKRPDIIPALAWPGVAHWLEQTYALGRSDAHSIRNMAVAFTLAVCAGILIGLLIAS